MGGVKKGNKNVRTFAGCNEGRSGVVRNRSLTNNRSRILERIPVMDVG